MRAEGELRRTCSIGLKLDQAVDQNKAGARTPADTWKRKDPTLQARRERGTRDAKWLSNRSL